MSEYLHRYSREEEKPKCGKCGAPGGETPLADIGKQGFLCELCHCTEAEDLGQQKINRALNIAVRQIKETVQACR